MSKIAVVTDSTACLPSELVQRYRIHVVPTWIHRGQEAFRDGLDISRGQVYRWLREGHHLRTSQPSVGEFLDHFQRLSSKAEAIVSILISGELSGTYGAAVQAAELVKGFPIRVIDSRTVAMGHGFVVLAAARAAEAGGDFGQVLEGARSMIPKVNLLAALETLEYVHRSGRIPGIAALVGSLLKISPVLEVKEGQARIFARVRTKKKALERLLQEARSRMGANLVHAAILHADAMEEAERLRHQVIQRFNLAEVYVTEIPPVLGVYGGPGVLGLAFYRE